MNAPPGLEAAILALPGTVSQTILICCFGGSRIWFSLSFSPVNATRWDVPSQDGKTCTTVPAASLPISRLSSFQDQRHHGAAMIILDFLRQLFIEILTALGAEVVIRRARKHMPHRFSRRLPRVKFTVRSLHDPDRRRLLHSLFTGKSQRR